MVTLVALDWVIFVSILEFFIEEIDRVTCGLYQVNCDHFMTDRVTNHFWRSSQRETASCWRYRHRSDSTRCYIERCWSLAFFCTLALFGGVLGRNYFGREDVGNL